MRTSTTHRLGSNSVTASSRASASPTAATTSKPSSLNNRTTPFLSSTESSATTVRMGAGDVVTSDIAATRSATRDLDHHRGRATRWRRERECAVDGIDAGSDAGDAGALRGVDTAHTVVVHRHPHVAPELRHVYRGDVGLGVLHHVGDRFVDDVVERLGNVGGEVEVGIDVDRDRDRRAGDHCRKGGVDAAILEDRRVQTTTELTQVTDRPLNLLAGADNQLASAVAVGVEVVLGHPEVKSDRHQLLLHAVVQ